MHAPELHDTALLQPCTLLYAPECTFAEQSVNEHKISVDTQCVVWSGQIVDLKIAHIVVYDTAVGCFCCFVYLVIFFCMFILLRNSAVERCTVRLILQLNPSSVKGWHTGITTACESVSPFSVTLSHISLNI